MILCRVRSLRGSNPLSRFRNLAQFRRKHALDCALHAAIQISEFARFAQNYAVPVSEFVRKGLRRNGVPSFFGIFRAGIVNGFHAPG
jgi:hypothetical protein